MSYLEKASFTLPPLCRSRVLILSSSSERGTELFIYGYKLIIYHMAVYCVVLRGATWCCVVLRGAA